MRLADLPEVRALSVREKLQLVDELWENVARDLDTLKVSPAEKRLLDKRWAAFVKNPESALNLDELKARVKVLCK